MRAAHFCIGFWERARSRAYQRSDGRRGRAHVIDGDGRARTRTRDRPTSACANDVRLRAFLTSSQQPSSAQPFLVIARPSSLSSSMCLFTAPCAFMRPSRITIAPITLLLLPLHSTITFLIQADQPANQPTNTPTLRYCKQSWKYENNCVCPLASAPVLRQTDALLIADNA